MATPDHYTYPVNVSCLCCYYHLSFNRLWREVIWKVEAVSLSFTSSWCEINSQYIFLNVNVLILVSHHLIVVEDWVPSMKQSILHTPLSSFYRWESRKFNKCVKAWLGQNSSLYQLASKVGFPKFPFCFPWTYGPFKLVKQVYLQWNVCDKFMIFPWWSFSDPAIQSDNKSIILFIVFSFSGSPIFPIFDSFTKLDMENACDEIQRARVTKVWETDNCGSSSVTLLHLVVAVLLAINLGMAVCTLSPKAYHSPATLPRFKGMLWAIWSVHIWDPYYILTHPVI